MNKCKIKNGLRGQHILAYRNNIPMVYEILKPYHNYTRYEVFNETLERPETMKTSEILKCERWC